MKPLYAPNFTQKDNDLPIKQMAPTLVEYRGVPTLTIHAKGMVAGMIGKPGQTVDNFSGQIMCCIYIPGQIALLHTMTPEWARDQANALLALADQADAAAAAAAADALKKAAGK